MSVEVSNVEPKEVWKNFVLLNEVPRPSKKEDRVIAVSYTHLRAHETN